MKHLLALTALSLAASCRNEPGASAAVEIAPAPSAGRTVSHPLSPATREKVAPARALDLELYYYNGSVKVPVWCDQEAITEFDASDAGAIAVAQAHPAAAELRAASGAGSVRVWRLDCAVDTAELCRELSAGPGKVRFSPTLYSSPTTHAQRRALPGGVIVRFEPDWSEARVEEWVGAQGLTVVQALLQTLNVYEVATAPGMESLEVANALHETGEVVYANPNWWTPKGRR